MAKRLNIEKTAYVSKIAEFMHQNHTTMWTLEETREKWRTERPYSKTIEQELIQKSLLFMSLLDSDLNHDFRAKILRFMARYLSVYVARSAELNGDTEKACAQLDAFFDAWLKLSEKRKSDSKNRSKQKFAKKSDAVSAKKPEPAYTKHVFKKGGKLYQEIVLRTGEKFIFAYESTREYRLQRMADIASVIAK